MKQYWGLSEFYYDHECRDGEYRIVPIVEVDRLIEKLRAGGYSVRELKDGRIIVRTPEEIAASNEKRKAAQAQGASRFTKLGAAFPKDMVKRFADACRTIGCTQSEVLLPIIESTINKAKEIKHCSNGTN